MLKKELMTNEQVKATEEELNLTVRMTEHPSLLKLVNVFDEPKRILIVTDLFESSGTLSVHLDKNIDERTAAKITL